MKITAKCPYCHSTHFRITTNQGDCYCESCKKCFSQYDLLNVGNKQMILNNHKILALFFLGVATGILLGFTLGVLT